VFDNQQHTADLFKALVLDLRRADDRKEGLVWIKRIETAEWHSTAFDQAVEEAGEGFGFDENCKLAFDGGPRDLLNRLGAVVIRYLEIISTPAKDTLFTTKEACEYVSRMLEYHGRKLSPTSVKQYIWEKKMLRGELLGPRTMVFRQAALDEFVTMYLEFDPKQGRHLEQATE
jgi:hypothetical protein